jgi:hypothetical protein
MNKLKEINTLVQKIAICSINLSINEVDEKFAKIKSEYYNRKLPIGLQIFVVEANSQKSEKDAVIISQFYEDLTDLYNKVRINFLQVLNLVDTLVEFMKGREANPDILKDFEGTEIKADMYTYTPQISKSQLIFYITEANKNQCFSFIRNGSGDFTINIIGAYKKNNEKTGELIKYEIYGEDIIRFIKHFNLYINTIENLTENINLTILKSYILIDYSRHAISENIIYVFGISGLESLFDRDSLTVTLQKVVENSLEP